MASTPIIPPRPSAAAFSLSQAQNRAEAASAKGSPFASYAYVRGLVFPSIADTDLDIRVPPALQVVEADEIMWMVVARGGAGEVYRDPSSTRKAWHSTHIYLRCTEASLACDLLLLVER